MTLELLEILIPEVFKKFMMTFFQLESQVEIIEDDSTKNYDNVIFISLFGNIEGGFILEIDNPTVQEFLNRLHQTLQEEVDLSQFVKGYIGEFANILVSRIINNMGKSFGNTFLSTPSLFRGMGMTANLFYDSSLNVTLKSNFGLFRVSFSFKD